jgi:hypothetical protein
MSTHKFDDPKIQARFDEKKARRELVIKQEAEDVFEVYLLKLATRTDDSREINILDDDLNCKSLDEIGIIIDLLKRKDKRINVNYQWIPFMRHWRFSKRVDKSSWW